MGFTRYAGWKHHLFCGFVFNFNISINLSGVFCRNKTQLERVRPPSNS